jgi:hypothetical protein
MKLSEYFEKAQGIGVLATADAKGVVNAALYAKPHFLDPADEETVAFVMSDRQSHANVQANPHAAYLFIEQAEDYVGRRLSLTKVREETDPEKVRAVRRRKLPKECEDDKPAFLVYFHVDGVRPLVGTE